MNRTAEQVEIDNLKALLADQAADMEKLQDRVKKVETAIGWAIAFASGVVGIITALRSGVIKWLMGASS